MSRQDAAAILLGYYGFALDDFTCVQVGPSSVQIVWHSAQAQPSEAELDAVTWTPAIAAAALAQRESKTVNRVIGVRKSADQATTSTSFSDVTDLVFQLAPNTHYKFKFRGAYTTAAQTTGLQLSVNGPASPAFLRFSGWLFTSVTATANAVGAAYDAALAATSGGGATPLQFEVEGTISTGAAGGPFSLRFRSEVNGSAVTILRGSFGELMAVN